MATTSKDRENGNLQQAGGMQTGMSGEVGSPISNEAYNVISALHAKLEGLEAYRKYSHDGSEQLWQKLTSSEMAGVRELVDELERMVKDGKLRMRSPGKTS
jgi:hypothetical protein